MTENWGRCASLYNVHSAFSVCCVNRDLQNQYVERQNLRFASSDFWHIGSSNIPKLHEDIWFICELSSSALCCSWNAELPHLQSRIESRSQPLHRSSDWVMVDPGFSGKWDAWGIACLPVARCICPHGKYLPFSCDFIGIIRKRGMKKVIIKKFWLHYFVTLRAAGCSEQPFPSPDCLEGAVTTHENTSYKVLLGCDSPAETSFLKRV